jgi:flagellar hook protein FlgE
MRGMYSAVSGLKTHQTALDVTANDLANVNTVGFKGARATFRDSLSQLQRAAAAATPGTGGANAAQVGLGVGLGSIDNMMGGGAMQTTGNPYDIAITGDGWLRVAPGQPDAANPTAAQPPAAQINYTRAGNLSRNNEGFLITADGNYVLGRQATAGGPDANAANGSYLFIPPNASDVAIGQDGSVAFVPAPGYTPVPGQVVSNGKVIAGYLTLAKFPNEAGLERVTNSRWRTSAASGAEAPGVPGGAYGVITGGALEMSNVDLASEFTDMISAQRGFQANSRVISTADQMLQDLVNLNR